MELSIPLNALFPGQDANPPVNARKTGRDVDVEQLAHSIEAKGMVQAITIKEADGKWGRGWYVVDGGRRLLAQQLRASWGVIAADDRIKCDMDAGAGEAIETSVHANFERVPLHEADMFEAVRAQNAKGDTWEQIALRFGIDEQRVKRWLALGSLAPEILDAWREGKFSNPVDCVRAFTLAPSLKDQVAVFNKLAKANMLTGWKIKEAFEGDRAALKALKTCGEEIYRLAGGAIIEDLFEGKHVVADPKLAIRLASEALDTAVARVALEGWSWVNRADRLDAMWSSWTQLAPGKGKPTKKERERLGSIELKLNKPGGSLGEDGEALERERDEINTAIASRVWDEDAMKKAGAVVSTTHQGEITILRGILAPAAAKAAKREQEKASKQDQRAAAEKVVAQKIAAGEEVEPLPPVSEFEDDVTLTQALRERMGAQATNAMRAAMLAAAREERGKQADVVGLCALLAGFMTGWRGNSPVAVRHEGMGHRAGPDYGKEAEPFADCLKRLVAMDIEELLIIAAQIAGDALDMTLRMERMNAIADVLPAPIVKEAIAEAFDAQDYFKSTASAASLFAIQEAVNEAEAKKLKNGTKAKMVEYAMTNVVPTGWLPPEFRTVHYDGPSMAKPAPGLPVKEEANG